MKVLAKLGLLLAIIVAGRQLRPASTAALAGQPSVSAVVARPDTLLYQSFASAQLTPVAPVSQRTGQQPQPQDPGTATWY